MVFEGNKFKNDRVSHCAVIDVKMRVFDRDLRKRMNTV